MFFGLFKKKHYVDNELSLLPRSNIFFIEVVLLLLPPKMVPGSIDEWKNRTV